MIKKTQKELEKYGYETVNDHRSAFHFRTILTQGIVTVIFKLLPPQGMKISVVASLPDGQVGNLGSRMMVHGKRDIEALAGAIHGRANYAIRCLDAFVAGLSERATLEVDR